MLELNPDLNYVKIWPYQLSWSSKDSRLVKIHAQLADCDEP